MIYSFNNIQVDTKVYRLLINGKEVPVEPQVFSLVVYLIQNKDRVVTRDQLLDHVWKGRIVSDISINNTIKSARKVLGDDGTQQRIIKTIHSIGYQFIAVTDNAQAPVSNHAESQEKPVETYSSITDIDLPHKEKETFLANKKTVLFVTFLLTAIIFLFFWRSIDHLNIEKSIETNGGEPEISASNSVVAQQALAVLPFTNTKPDLESDYLSFALASQIIGDLNYLENFALRPAGSISKYANQVIDPISIGQKLKVDYVVSGNYLLENKKVRLNIELIEVNSSRSVWKESMQVDYANTFALQDMVAQKVAKGLGVNFRQNHIDRPYKNTPNNALAYEYYLRAISYPQSNVGHSMAVKMLQKSIELDPHYAPSYAHLGFQRRLLEQHGRIAPNGLKGSEWYYLKALEINPELLEALSNLSALYTETNRIEEALLITRRMLDINPDDANTHFALSYIYRYAGMLDESIEEGEIALAISPGNGRFRSIIAAYSYAGRYQEALEKTYLDTSEYGIGHTGMIAFKQSRFDQAKVLFAKVIDIDPDGIWGLTAKLHTAIIDAKPKVALSALTEMTDTDVIDSENLFFFAECYALLEQNNAALNMLTKAVDAGWFNYPSIVNSAAFSNLKAEPSYRESLEKAKQRHDAFRADFL